ncbi:uncharacterized protein LOC100826964 [Brachypodium distachyon]|uniref:FLZ-type domain-containing protein n=1 Tax=Brachypodium distachyon TaxID=15368 RepID=I1HR04_BRADI|nr:uncharacterized protein LOC100826964 [Brachypodium distachyon]KQK09494.1 hypothetical protein BRADI_2g48330v3 [Brachypodium distachyon]|eukprot:XP_010232245.2 uncharacterized protein LOC100826964 [Brachypodium distachyon]
MEDCTDRNLAQRRIIPTGFFGVPGLFVRLSSKGLNEVDPNSVCIPTSPLDFKNLPSNNAVRTNLKPPRLQGIEADLKLRMSPPRVGLGLVNALTAHESKLHSGFKNPFLALGLPRVTTDASPQNNGSIGITMNGIIDFALSEEYTCVIHHGPNPKTTHILGGETLEVYKGVQDGSKRPIFTIKPTGEQSWLPSLAGVASGLCSCCRKRLRKDRDIYMHVGEKTFCSNECRKTEEAKLTYAGCWQLLCSLLVKLVVVARKCFPQVYRLVLFGLKG